MGKLKTTDPTDALELSVHVANVLSNAGIKTIGALCNLTERQLRALTPQYGQGLRPKDVRAVVAELEVHGLHLTRPGYVPRVLQIYKVGPLDGYTLGAHTIVTAYTARQAIRVGIAAWQKEMNRTVTESERLPVGAKLLRTLPKKPGLVYFWDGEY